MNEKQNGEVSFFPQRKTGLSLTHLWEAASPERLLGTLLASLLVTNNSKEEIKGGLDK